MKTVLTSTTGIALLAMTVAVESQGNFAGRTERPLRYRPDGTDFVIENGREFFNRPLYGTNTAFRVDAGDRPEFSLYLPGRGGNLRLGIAAGTGHKWLFDAAQVSTRYRPGSMLYEIRDPLLGGGTLDVRLLAMSAAEGLVARVLLRETTTPVELVWAYGGASGQRGRRDGDIGTEPVPTSQFFQLQPEFCRGNAFAIDGRTFVLRSKPATIVGLAPRGSRLVVADATHWTSFDDLMASAGRATELPVLVGRVSLRPAEALHLGLQRVADGGEAQAYAPDDLPRVFDESEQHRQALAGRVTADTPDPFINAAVSALTVSGDAVWDEPQGVFMHGAVAWRSKLLGWRGPYVGDALGWHDRARRHFTYWAGRQNTSPIAAGPVAPDPAVNFARNEPALHSNGDMSNSHYDMNAVYVDALFRHILWTGDLEFARTVWPVIERHLAWERRLFRRPFGADGLPLYEAYTVIWASDDLEYHGGGVTHATAYNYFHNRMAARLATRLGAEASAYEREADRIAQAMRRELWLADRGWFAEWKDLLGLQLPHPNAALWTFYHTVDSEVPDAKEAWQMSRFVDTQIARIPLSGPGVPAGEYHTLPTTSWMPYRWSTNNVVMSEVAHTSLAYWRAGRGAAAFRLFKGSILDSMFMGLCPGNAGMTSFFDMARGEAQRDFADSAGVLARALVEGLFGVRPDSLSGELLVRPGLPAEWDHAKLQHPDFTFGFRRAGLTETYSVEPRFGTPLRLRLRVAALRDAVAAVTVNGQPAAWRVVEDAVEQPRIEIDSAPAPRHDVVIAWKGQAPATTTAAPVVARGTELRASFGAAELLDVADPQRAFDRVTRELNALRALAVGASGHRSVFARVRQGELTWWMPIAFEIRPAHEVLQVEGQDAGSLRFVLRNNTAAAVERAATIRAGGRSVTASVAAAPFSDSAAVSIDAVGLATGSNRIAVDLGNGASATGLVSNWKVTAPATARWDAVDLTALFNDRVTRIFKNEYLTPRSPYVSLAIPKQGIGSWVHWEEHFDVDDTGLRAAADRNGGRLILPQGVPFATPGPGDAKNIAFTSQWDNYPREVTVPLQGRASHVYLLMAGSTNQMQSRFDNGEVVVTYADGTAGRLALHNPTTWWPIDQDYFVDDFAFRRPEPIPPRVDLRTGEVRVLDPLTFKGKGGKIPGGAALVLDLPLDEGKTLTSLTVRTLANEVVIGLMAATLTRDR